MVVTARITVGIRFAVIFADDVDANVTIVGGCVGRGRRLRLRSANQVREPLGSS